MVGALFKLESGHLFALRYHSERINNISLLTLNLNSTTVHILDFHLCRGIFVALGDTLFLYLVIAKEPPYP